MAHIIPPTTDWLEDLEETYLYDGVYAGNMGWAIRLRTVQKNGDHVIYIDRTLWETLLHYGAGKGWPVKA